MKTLPNGITVFNATPHDIYFWDEGWDSPVQVPIDALVNAETVETSIVESRNGIDFVAVQFVPTTEGQAIIDQALAAGADIVAGSIIAAQAYRGRVAAMLAAPGYERVPPAEKRMNPYRFLVY